MPPTLHRAWTSKAAADLADRSSSCRAPSSSHGGRQAVDRDDQLRQRVTFALSEIFVISSPTRTLSTSRAASPSYYDMLGENAFGNYRDLLEDVTCTR